jgi:hypothetical protein
MPDLGATECLSERASGSELLWRAKLGLAILALSLMQA